MYSVFRNYKSEVEKVIDKNKQVDSVIKKLKNIDEININRNKYNQAFAAISSAAEILYTFNQKYADDELENLTISIGNKLKEKYKIANHTKQDCTDTILVYDGFGLDTRGVILMYLNALGINGYSVCYVTDNAVRGSIPTIKEMCDKYSFKMQFVDMSDYLKSFSQLSQVFEKEKPKVAFFYTTPFDSSASAVFHIYEGLCTRYLVDLTDHAFWLGKCANDYFLGSREMSAYIEHFERGIPKEKCIKLGVNLLTEDIKDHSGLPFDIENTRFLFSGGALYKTLGDDHNYYYKIINHIMECHENIKFLYAGTGDDCELKKLVTRFPNRVFHINERKDFFYIIQHCTLYLNTYPMFGGMMMKYSALAHKLPITLKHGSDSDGLLLNQKECRIEYDSYEELIADVDLLLNDTEYLNDREKLLEGSVITEERFARNVKGVIENHRTDYSHDFEILDTKKFRQEYYERFDIDKTIQLIAKKKNMSLFRYFPVAFIQKISKQVIKRKDINYD